MLTFLHLSDLHLDGIHRRHGKRLNEAIKASFRHAVEDAIEQKLDLVLITGDLFDHKHLTYATESFLMQCFNRLARRGIPLYYGLGNHDYLDRVRGFGALSLPENVVVFDRPEARTVAAVTGGGTPYRIVGSGYDRRWIEEDVVSSYPEKQDEIITLGMAHTGLEDPHYMPVSRTTLQDKGYDYFALGHLHDRQRITERIAYAGSIVGLDETETGPRGGYIGRIDGEGLTLEAVDYSALTRESLSVVLPEGLEDLSSIEEHLIAASREVGADLIVMDLVITSGNQERLMEMENRSFLEDSLAERLGLVDLHLRKITRKRELERLEEGSWLWLLREHLDNGRLVAALEKDPELMAGIDRERLDRIFQRLVDKGLVDHDLT